MKQRIKKVRKQSSSLFFDKKLLVFSGFLLVTLFILVAQVQVPQNTKSRAQVVTNCDINTTDMSVDAEEQAMLTKVNEYRKSKGLGELKISHDLQRAASWHTFDMKTKNYLSHTDSTKRDFPQRVKDCGYTGQRSAENVAKIGPDNPDVFNGWKNSPPHNSNMLNPNFTTVGIGASGDFWTMDFGSEDENGDTAVPSGTMAQPSIAQPSNTPFGIIQPCPSCGSSGDDQPRISPPDDIVISQFPQPSIGQDPISDPIDSSSNNTDGKSGGLVAAILGFLKALLEVLLALFKG